jgi:hypothetical protein
MGGHAPPLGPLLERARTEGDDPAPPQRPAHAAALARSLRDAALARDWPRAAGTFYCCVSDLECASVPCR